MSVIKLFPTLLFARTLSPAKSKRLNADLLSDVQVLMKIDKAGLSWSKQNYVGGYTSYSSITDLHLRHSPFMELKSIIDKDVKKYISELEFDLQGRSVKMTTCWVNVMPSQVHHSLHLHPLGCISGTYYVQIPKGSGNLKLEDPRMGLFMAAPPRRAHPKKNNPYTVHVSPKPGQLFLWESWLRHEVSANRGSGQRVSVSFNYEWI